MTHETREKIDSASADWDAANRACHRLLGMMQALDISSKEFDAHFDAFCEAQSARRAAGDRHMAAIRLGWIEDDAPRAILAADALMMLGGAKCRRCI